MTQLHRESRMKRVRIGLLPMWAQWSVGMSSSAPRVLLTFLVCFIVWQGTCVCGSLAGPWMPVLGLLLPCALVLALCLRIASARSPFLRGVHFAYKDAACRYTTALNKHNVAADIDWKPDVVSQRRTETWQRTNRMTIWLRCLIAVEFVAAPVLFCTGVVQQSELLIVGWGILVVAGLASIAVLIRLNHHRDQAAAPTISELRSADHRVPVLLLRSFRDDDLPVQAFRRVRRQLVRSNWERHRFEPFLVGLLSNLGPPIAIGRPGEPLPAVGAARDYLTNEQWQAKASQMIEESQFVVLLVGETGGVWWEMNHLASQRALGKCIMIVPPAAGGGTQRRFHSLDSFFAMHPELACAGPLPIDTIAVAFDRLQQPVPIVSAHQFAEHYVDAVLLALRVVLDNQRSLLTAAPGPREPELQP